MSFILPYECEFCGYVIKGKKEDLPKLCPSCKNEKDTRYNIEKYGCVSYGQVSCGAYEGNNDCRLSKLPISDIECPLAYVKLKNLRDY